MSAQDDHDPRGVGTTGHQWDGIRELNNPLPRWWLWTFYATVLFALVYCLLYPAWPLVNGATSGLLGWSTRGAVAQKIEAAQARQAPFWDRLAQVPLDSLHDDPDLNRFAEQAGAALFRTNCSQCHGSGAAGATGYPNLLDDDWLWGGGIDQIATTIRHGIRSADDDQTRFSQMPAFGTILSRDEIRTVAAHVRAMADGQPADQGPGARIFADNCAVCHGPQGHGNREMGAPNLTDAIWLYGGDPGSIQRTITRGPFGVMPAWGGKLGEGPVRALAAYVHGLGGGE